MKLTAILLTIACLQVAARTDGQVISLSAKNKPLEKVLADIKKQSGFNFIYGKELISKAGPVNIDVKNQPLAMVLDLVFRQQPLGYSISENYVILSPKSAAGIQPADIYEELPLPPIDVKGRIINESGEPVVASIVVRGTHNGTTSNADGYFEIKGVDENATLVITGVSIQPQEVKVNNRTSITVTVKIVAAEGEAVTVSTGYQDIPKERATGSFAKVDNELFNRQVSPDVISRLKGIAPSLLFDERSGSTKLNIRGLSTILANDQPLIIVDNFPFNGDINTINPNDIEDITILRDAAAASIWGVRAGNGVIVIKTKRGTMNQAPSVSLISNFTIGSKPDLFYQPKMSTSDFIDVETMLFDNNYFNATLNDFRMPAVSPVVEILLKKRNGAISAAEADAQINSLRGLDVRNDLKKYMYQNRQNQQYAVNLSGGTNNYSYFLSTGFDRNLSEQTGNQNNRISINTNHIFRPVKGLELDARLVYTQSAIDLDNTLSNIRMGGREIPFYTRLVDDQGNAIPLVKNYREDFVNAAPSQGFLNWEFNPLEELKLTSNRTKLFNVRAAAGIKYTITSGLSSELRYQYESQMRRQRNEQSVESYAVRDLINRYSVFDGTAVTARNIPLGGILTFGNSDMKAHNWRGQVNYNRSFGDHTIAALAGMEVREAEAESFSTRYYGYAPELGSSVVVNYLQNYVTYPANTSSLIPNIGTGIGGTIDRFRSYFANGAYTYKNRYTFSVSGRIDQSNLFGVKSNQRSAPLWSVGGKWDLHKESFYNMNWLPVLQLKATYGYNGNIDQTVTAYTTARFRSALYSLRPAASLVNPPNPELRWEKSRMINIGLDFGLKNNVLNGSVEYYQKRGIDLLGQAPLDPTTGFTQFKGNVASMKGSGFDIELHSINTDKKIRWQTDFLFSYAADEITEYHYDPANFLNHFSDASVERSIFQLIPTIGKPLYGLYSYRWAGLDPNTGAPRGYVNGIPSTNYTTIQSNSTIDSLIFHGRALPPVFGALRNSFTFRGISLSFNIAYRFGYYFRRRSIQYNSLYSSYNGHSDYARRWQQPGDEINTTVPAMIYPANATADAFYYRSEVLVEKGDNIRLQDIRLGYDITPARPNRTGIKKLSLYSYINNLGILWRANEKGIDPDYPNLPIPVTYTFGLRADF